MNKLQQIIRKKKSNLCAGLDLPPVGMGREGQAFSDVKRRLDFALDYIDEVADYAAALKINFKYWLYDEDLTKVMRRANQAGLYLIMDTKTADISDTNEAEFYSHNQQGADAVTLSPFPGNAAAAIKYCDKLGLDVFPMCLMSNPEYALIKNYLVPIPAEDINFFRPEHTVEVNDQVMVPFYLKQIFDIVVNGAMGGVIGTTGHITESELRAVATYARPDNVFLCPGIGSQGGTPDLLLEILGKDRVLFNVGRALMFPDSQRISSTAAKFQQTLYQ